MSIIPQCIECKHLDAGRPIRCQAFPDGIPTPILLAQADHRKPYPGDRGIRFEPRPEEAAAHV